MKSPQSPTCPDCETSVIRVVDTDKGREVYHTEEHLWCLKCSEEVTEPVVEGELLW
jgi:hypothetical protein